MAQVYRKQWSDTEGGSPFGPNFRFDWHWLKWLIPAVVVLWFSSGIYIVRPGERGVVRRFGKAVRVTQPGPHYHLPGPIEKIDKIKVETKKPASAEATAGKQKNKKT